MAKALAKPKSSRFPAPAPSGDEAAPSPEKETAENEKDEEKQGAKNEKDEEKQETKGEDGIWKKGKPPSPPKEKAEKGETQSSFIQFEEMPEPGLELRDGAAHSDAVAAATGTAPSAGAGVAEPPEAYDESELPPDEGD